MHVVAGLWFTMWTRGAGPLTDLAAMGAAWPGTANATTQTETDTKPKTRRLRRGIWDPPCTRGVSADFSLAGRSPACSRRIAARWWREPAGRQVDFAGARRPVAASRE